MNKNLNFQRDVGLTPVMGGLHIWTGFEHIICEVYYTSDLQESNKGP